MNLESGLYLELKRFFFFFISVILPSAFSYSLDTFAVLPVSKDNFIEFALGKLLNLPQNQLLWTFSLLFATGVLNAVV